jgi:hypothetical protein
VRQRVAPTNEALVLSCLAEVADGEELSRARE